MALRAPAGKQMLVDGKDVVPDVHSVLNAIKAFTSAVRSGAKLGATGKPIKNVISIGIGGSYLGPEYVYEALRAEPTAKKAAAGRTLRFLANVDPVDVDRATQGLNPEETMVIVVSKTFTTAETMLNARTLRKWLVDELAKRGVSEADAVSKHMIAASSAVPLVEKFGIDKANIFGFWDWVGGRYSVTSAVGILPLALQYGFEICEQFLAGAHDMDVHLLEAPFRQNLPVIMGLLGVWNSSFLGHSSRALLRTRRRCCASRRTSSRSTWRATASACTVEGVELPFAAGEINFGEPGTKRPAQLLPAHPPGPASCRATSSASASRRTPCTSRVSPCRTTTSSCPTSSRSPTRSRAARSLKDLEAEGVPAELRQHKLFPGKPPVRVACCSPSSTQFTCGQLLALYEHRTVVQGAIWGLNSFDQWGVEARQGAREAGLRNQLQAVALVPGAGAGLQQLHDLHAQQVPRAQVSKSVDQSETSIKSATCCAQKERERGNHSVCCIVIMRARHWPSIHPSIHPFDVCSESVSLAWGVDVDAVDAYVQW
ncbi:hypothetical protein PINS_up024149 [Pythium insidiosum]|nr:hypothetical protein PINS_up024149 [Pythium insidiosum]